MRSERTALIVGEMPACLHVCGMPEELTCLDGVYTETKAGKNYTKCDETGEYYIYFIQGDADNNDAARGRWLISDECDSETGWAYARVHTGACAYETEGRWVAFCDGEYQEMTSITVKRGLKSGDTEFDPVELECGGDYEDDYEPESPTRNSPCPSPAAVVMGVIAEIDSSMQSARSFPLSVPPAVPASSLPWLRRAAAAEASIYQVQLPTFVSSPVAKAARTEIKEMYALPEDEEAPWEAPRDFTPLEEELQEALASCHLSSSDSSSCCLSDGSTVEVGAVINLAWLHSIVDRSKHEAIAATDVQEAKQILRSFHGLKRRRFRISYSPDMTGGKPRCSRWRRNPQIEINVQHSAHQLMGPLRRIYVAVHAPAEMGEIAVHVLRNTQGDSSPFRQALPSAKRVAASGFRLCCASLDFVPDLRGVPEGEVRRYIVVPCTRTPSRGGDVVVHISAQNDEWDAAPVSEQQVHYSCVQGTWNYEDGTAGGALGSPSHLSNVQWRLSLMEEQPTNVCILCTQEEGQSFYKVIPTQARRTYEVQPAAIHVFQNRQCGAFNAHSCINPHPDGHDLLSTRLPGAHRLRYHQRQEVALELRLIPHERDPSRPLFVIASLEKAMLEGSYSLSVLSDKEVAELWQTG